MYEQGWVSCRMAAAKLGCHVSTVHRMAQDGVIRASAIMMVGKTRYLELGALVASQTEQVQKTFGLNDWSDVLAPPAPPSRRRVAR